LWQYYWGANDMDNARQAKTMQKYWIGRGVVTCPDVAEILGVNIGDDEWQFSDGPAGARSSSADYKSVEAGVKDLAPAIFVWDVDQTEG
jgi:hypothetical protein